MGSLLIALLPFVWPLPALAGGSARKDVDGDPLPPGAIARLGTTRFRAPATYLFPSVRFLPDQEHLLLRHAESTFVMDAQTGKIVRELKRSFQAMALSPDGKLLAATAFGQERRAPELCILDWPSTKQVDSIPLGTKRRETAVAFSGPRTVVVADDMLREWDIDKKQAIRRKPLLENSRPFLSEDGKCVVFQEDKPGAPLLLWGWQSDKLPRPLGGRQFGLRDALFSADGSLLAATSNTDAFLRLWDVASGRLLRKLPSEDGRSILVMAFARDGKTLAATGYHSGKVLLWDVKTGTVKGRLNSLGARHFAWALAFSGDGKSIAAAGLPGVHVWDLQTGKVRQQDLGHYRELWAIAFSPRGDLIATAANDGTARLWQARTGKQVHVLQHDADSVYHLDFSPDGARLATSCFDDTVRMWDTASGRQVLKLAGHGRLGHDRRVRFSADGTRLASWGHFYLRAFDVMTGKALGDHRPLPSGVKCDDEGQIIADPKLQCDRAGAAFDPHGILALTDTEAVRLLDPVSGKQIGQLPRPGGSSDRVMAFSPEGKLLALAPYQFQSPYVEIWNVPDRQRVQLFKLPEAADDLAWSPDSRSLALVVERKVQIWELASGKVRLTIDNLSAGARCVAFAPDGRLLVVGLRDSSALVFDLARLAK